MAAPSCGKIRLKEKLVIIVNGKGGSGKDTVCDIASGAYSTETISAITPIKEIAAQFGWNGEKDRRARKFLADLKRTFIDYNDLPTRYLEGEYHRFEQGDTDILFVHIREKDQIDAFKNVVRLKCVTLLVRSQRAGGGARYGNEADDNAEDYGYDYRYDNETPIEALEEHFLGFFHGLLVREGVL